MFFEIILRSLPTIFIIFILEKLVKLDKIEKVYIFFILALLSNTFVYYVFKNIGMAIDLTAIFAVRLSIILFVINIIFMYLFVLYRNKNK